MVDVIKLVFVKGRVLMNFLFRVLLSFVVFFVVFTSCVNGVVVNWRMLMVVDCGENGEFGKLSLCVSNSWVGVVV